MFIAMKMAMTNMPTTRYRSFPIRTLIYKTTSEIVTGNTRSIASDLAATLLEIGSKMNEGLMKRDGDMYKTACKKFFALLDECETAIAPYTSDINKIMKQLTKSCDTALFGIWII